MVATTFCKCAQGEELDPRSLRPLNNRRVRSVVSARTADRVLEWFDTGEGDKPGEVELFSALQVCAYRATRKPRGEQVTCEERCKWARRWKQVRDYLVEANLGLVYTMISRFHGKDLDWDEQRSDALYAMIRAVDGYNPWSGFKFSTYACNTITRALIHLSKKTTKLRHRFPVEHESWLEKTPRVDDWSDLFSDRLHRALDRSQGALTAREAAVLGWRFPLDGGRSLTLGEIGAAIGLSKERARQIQEQALGKLRVLLEADPALQ